MNSRRVAAAGLVVAAAIALSGCSAVLTAMEGTHPAQRNAASDIQVQSDVLSATLAIVNYLVTTERVPTSVSDLTAYGFYATTGVTNWVITGSGREFCVSASSPGGKSFHATQSSQTEPGPC
jgi:hypothetical protein